MSKKTYEGYIGVDVSKKHLDVFIRTTGEIFRVENEKKGLREMKKRLGGYRDYLIAVEATGGYESLVVSMLQKEGFTVAVVNPFRVRAFAKASGHLAKTDKIDAKVLSHFAQVMEPAKREMESQEEEELKAKRQRRNQLVDMITAEKNRLLQSSDCTKKDIKKTIKFLEDQLGEIERWLSLHIQKNAQWRAKSELLQSVKGVGETTATVLVAELPELGKISHKEIASLVGVAPFNKDSGDQRGKREISGGRASVRRALYMATLVAVKHNAMLKRFYEKLCLAGKKKKVALIACMRKLLIIMNAMVRNNCVWQNKIIPKNA